MKLTQSIFGKLIMPLFAFFNIINIIFYFWGQKWDSINVNHIVVIFGNSLLFLLAIISLWLHLNASKKENPNVLLRSIMMSTFVKMLVIAISVLVYVKIYKSNKSIWAVLVTMLIYLIYMFIEVKIALQLNKKIATNANN